MVLMFVNGKMRQGNWHSNGGGFVETSAACSADSYLGPMCRVIDTASVSEACHIDGQVLISHQANVYGGSNLSEHVIVRDFAQVFGGAQLSGYSIVKDKAKVNGGSMKDQAVVRNQANIRDIHLEKFQSYPTVFVLGSNG